jgi:uncharacterized protein (TIGR03435 family)
MQLPIPIATTQAELFASALVQTRNGHNLKPSASDDGAGMEIVRGRKLCLSGHSATLNQPACLLSGPLGIPVLDKTGLKGRYAFNYLRLEARKLPIDMLIVDHIERKPVEN